MLSHKIDKYRRFCQRKVKDADGKERPMWRTRWWVPAGRHGDQPHPPLLLIFNRVGPLTPNTVIAQLAELTQRHWQGTAHDGFHLYDGKLPIVVTSMRLLKEHGPAGKTFRRFGHPHNQTLLAAIGNPTTKRTTPAGRPSTKPASGRPAVPCASAAAPGSPTNGGRPSNPPDGTPHGRPTRTCATTASSRPSPPRSRPRRPTTSTRSRTRWCQSKRPAAGSIATPTPQAFGVAFSPASKDRL
jgi:hypothetical protein